MLASVSLTAKWASVAAPSSFAVWLWNLTPDCSLLSLDGISHNVGMITNPTCRAE